MKKKSMLKEKKICPFDIFIFIFIIALSIYLTCLSARPSAYLKVTADDETFRYPLNKNAVYDLKGPLGITQIEILDGKARIISSPCPNKTCVKEGFSSTLVCLPNKIIATKEGKTFEGEVDAISQ